MNAEAERANLVVQTEGAYRRGILVAALAKVGHDHWRTTGDAFGLLLAADLFEGTAQLFGSIRTLPEEEHFVRSLAMADREHAAIIREQVNAYQDTPRAFMAVLDPTWAQAIAARERGLREELARLAPQRTPGFLFQLPVRRHTHRVSRLRLLPWLGLFLAAYVLGATASGDWWFRPALVVGAFAVSMIFFRLGLHRIR